MPPPVSSVASAATDGVSEINAHPEWQILDFVSDLHLQHDQTANFAAWRNYLSHTTADALFILGDLFEVWVGDDLTLARSDPQAEFAITCQSALCEASKRVALYFIHGNRDFLLGASYADGCAMKLLSDPTVLCFDGQRWLISHGDALCIDDTEYQKFRLVVRSQVWQSEFLAKPLTERQKIAKALRSRSDGLKATGISYADVDTAAATAWLTASQATTLIHGHTHKPADHWLKANDPGSLRRLVLSDWDAEAQPPRLEILRLQRGAAAPQRLNLASGF